MSDFDPMKEAKNIVKHRISLQRWVDMIYLSVADDERTDYGEPRFRAYGPIDGKDYCFVFTICNGKTRPISLRRAHAKEMKRHVPKS